MTALTRSILPQMYYSRNICFGPTFREYPRRVDHDCEEAHRIVSSVQYFSVLSKIFFEAIKEIMSKRFLATIMIFIFKITIKSNQWALIHQYFQHCGSQPRQHCYPETKCHRIPETKCTPIQKEKCTKVPVETTEYVEETQCLPFELDLAQLTAQQGDPCAGYQVATSVQVLTFDKIMILC